MIPTFFASMHGKIRWRTRSRSDTEVQKGARMLWVANQTATNCQNHIANFWQRFLRGNAMKINEISGVIVDASFKIHATLGPGLLESVYEAILQRELTTCGLNVQRQVPIPIRWEDMEFDEGFRADWIGEDRIVVELKSVENLAPVHPKQVLTYVRLLDYRLGLLINFGAPLLKQGLKRIINGKIEE